MAFEARQDVRQAEISAVIVRANGEKVDLGTIAFYHRNPLVRFARSIGIRLRAAANRMRRG